MGIGDQEEVLNQGDTEVGSGIRQWDEESSRLFLWDPQIRKKVREVMWQQNREEDKDFRAFRDAMIYRLKSALMDGGITLARSNFQVQSGRINDTFWHGCLNDLGIDFEDVSN